MGITEALKAQIKSKRSLLKKLKDQEKEFRRLQEAVAQIPKIQADLSALERSLAILKGEEIPEPAIIASKLPKVHIPTGNTIPGMVHQVLKEAGKPLTIDQMLPLIVARGRQVGKLTLMSVIYRCVKKEQFFRLVSRGTFGLLEWPE